MHRTGYGPINGEKKIIGTPLKKNTKDQKAYEKISKPTTIREVKIKITMGCYLTSQTN